MNILLHVRDSVTNASCGVNIGVDADHPLHLEAAVGDIPVLELEHGLSALFSRSAWYRLVDLAQDLEGAPTVTSGDYPFSLMPHQ